MQYELHRTDTAEGVSVRLETPRGAFSGSIRIPKAASGRRGEMTLPEFGREIVRLSEAFSRQAIEEAERLGRGVSCGKGCGACCSQLVTISPPEAWMLGKLVGSFPERKRLRIRERIARIGRRLEEAGLLDRLGRLDDPDLSEEEHGRLAEDYFALGTPCPFIQDGVCGIYPDRPSICREYLVLSPAAHCANPFENVVEALWHVPRLSETLAGLSAQVMGTEVQLIPIALAPEWAERHGDWREKRWKAEYLVSRFFTHLEIVVGSQKTPAPPDDHPPATSC